MPESSQVGRSVDVDRRVRERHGRDVELRVLQHALRAPVTRESAERIERTAREQHWRTQGSRERGRHYFVLRATPRSDERVDMLRRDKGLIGEQKQQRVRGMRDGTRRQGDGGAHTFFMSVVDDHELRSIAGSGGDGGTFVPRDEDAAIAADPTCDIGSTTHERFAVHRFEQLAASETP